VLGSRGFPANPLIRKHRASDEALYLIQHLHGQAKHDIAAQCHPEIADLSQLKAVFTLYLLQSWGERSLNSVSACKKTLHPAVINTIHALDYRVNSIPDCAIGCQVD